MGLQCQAMDGNYGAMECGMLHGREVLDISDQLETPADAWQMTAAWSDYFVSQSSMELM